MPKPSTQSRTRSAVSDRWRHATSRDTGRRAPEASHARRSGAALRSRRVEGGLVPPELGDRRLAVHPLARDAVQVRPRAQLREDGEGEHLHAPAEQVVGGQRLVAHLRRSAASAGPTCRSAPGWRSPASSSMSSSSTYHQVASRNWASSLSGRKRSGSREEARLGPELGAARSPSPSCAGALAVELELDQLRRHELEQAEVEERDAPVVHQQEVAGVRVAGELVVAVHAAEEEAEDDLAHAVARRPGRASLIASKPRAARRTPMTSTRSRERRGDHVRGRR